MEGGIDGGGRDGGWERWRVGEMEGGEMDSGRDGGWEMEGGIDGG